MQAYKFDIHITKDGVITLPFEPKLFDREVELIIRPKKVKRLNPKVSPSEFVRKWSGKLKGLPENDPDFRYEYLRKKYGLTSEAASEDEIDEARYKYLIDKYK